MSEIQAPAPKTTQDKPADQQAKKPEQSLAVQRIFIKSSVFEAVALTDELLKSMPSPVIDMQAQANFSERSKNNYEAVLSLHLTAKVDGNLLWKIQLQQAGLYKIEGFSEEQCKQILNGYCMNQLYPYAAATVTAMVTQGGFAPAYLSPMDFDMLYREQQKRELSAVKH